MTMQSVLQKISIGQNLTVDEMRTIMNTIMSGDATPAQTGAFLMGMRMKGETADEIGAAVSIMREKMIPVSAPADAIDIVGTGGDGGGTYNISTAASIVVAASGVPVAKHGNKALSSKSGSSEALLALGVKLDLAPDMISKCVTDAGIGFMFAPNHHPAMKYVGPARVEMGVRTMFNLLGPQSNPASVKKYLLGVFDKQWVEPVAQSLLSNGATSAWVVHGSDGLDEITTTGSTYVSAIENGAVRSFEISPTDVGLPIAQAQDLVGGDPEHNAAAITALFDGEKSAYRDIVVLNAGASLLIAGHVDDLQSGVEQAQKLIDTGAAKQALSKLVSVSNA